MAWGAVMHSVPLSSTRANHCSHHSTGCYYCAIAYSHSSQHSGIGSFPDVLADVNGSIAHTLTHGRVKVVVDSDKHDVVSNECTFVDGDAALILIRTLLPLRNSWGGHRLNLFEQYTNLGRASSLETRPFL